MKKENQIKGPENQPLDNPPRNLFVYGDGKIWTQQGEVGGVRCLTINRMESAMPVGAVPSEWRKQYGVDECDCILAFKSLESARTLQDELNELISKWSKESAEVVDFSDKPQP